VLLLGGFREGGFEKENMGALKLRLKAPKYMGAGFAPVGFRGGGLEKENIRSRNFLSLRPLFRQGILAEG
jgi:hypothetical protein